MGRDWNDWAGDSTIVKKKKSLNIFAGPEGPKIIGTLHPDLVDPKKAFMPDSLTGQKLVAAIERGEIPRGHQALPGGAGAGAQSRQRTLRGPASRHSGSRIAGVFGGDQSVANSQAFGQGQSRGETERGEHERGQSGSPSQFPSTIRGSRQGRLR